MLISILVSLIMQQSFFAICSPVETTIVPPGGCKYNGKIYPLGTYIYKHECGFVKCAEGGHILVGDKGCAIPYNDEIATLPPQPNTCKYDGKKYKDGEFIYKHKCGFLKCGSGGMLIAGDYNCAFPTRSRKTTPTPIPTKPKGCYHNGKFFKPGEYIYKHKCGATICDQDGNIFIADYDCGFKR